MRKGIAKEEANRNRLQQLLKDEWLKVLLSFGVDIFNAGRDLAKTEY